VNLHEALAAAAALGVERLDAQLLLLHVLGRDAGERAWLLAHDGDPLEPAARQSFEQLCARRAAGEPLAYLVGHKEFFGLRLQVDARVLVPRPDTETLVDWALALLDGELRDSPAPALLDLGTGSGAIALALKNGCPRAQVWAGERSADALAVAQGNATRLGLHVRFIDGDWWQALDRASDAPAFDLVVSNPPYIAAGDPHLAALAHEPLDALVAADDGLADIERIATGAPGRLRAGGWLLFEHGWTQAAAVRAVLAAAGFGDLQTRADLEGRPRCTGGRLGA
jgi:release factor glutamine methyltransferase